MIGDFLLGLGVRGPVFERMGGLGVRGPLGRGPSRSLGSVGGDKDLRGSGGVRGLVLTGLLFFS